MSEGKRKDWRELCAAVSNERDSNKLVFLIDELIRALDDQERAPRVVAISGNADDVAFSSG
jgi:hypothetical protein